MVGQNKPGQLGKRASAECITTFSTDFFLWMEVFNQTKFPFHCLSWKLNCQAEHDVYIPQLQFFHLGCVDM